MEVCLPIRVQEGSDLIEDSLRGKLRLLEDDSLVNTKGYRRLEGIGQEGSNDQDPLPGVPLIFFEAGWVFREGVAAGLETILSLETEAVLFGREGRP